MQLGSEPGHHELIKQLMPADLQRLRLAAWGSGLQVESWSLGWPTWPSRWRLNSGSHQEQVSVGGAWGPGQERGPRRPL